jgi:hypothetical protein
MLKATHSVKDLERRAALLLEELLLRVPNLAVKPMTIEPSDKDMGIDILVRVRLGERVYFLLCEVKQSGQPRFAREAINQLRAYRSRSSIQRFPSSLPRF